jgi:hypothetical protein
MFFPFVSKEPILGPFPVNEPKRCHGLTAQRRVGACFDLLMCDGSKRLCLLELAKGLRMIARFSRLI